MKNPFRHKKSHKLNDLFQTSAELIERTLTKMEQTLIALADQKYEDLRKFVRDIVDYEKDVDKIHDEIIENIYARETMVFSRADRLTLANFIDDVIDMAENVVRRVGSYYSPLPSIKFTELIKMIALNLKNMGEFLHQIVDYVLYDFKAAEALIPQIRATRRSTRNSLWTAIEELFAHTTESAPLLYYDRLLHDLRNTIDAGKILSDEIRNLIIKYRI